MKRLLFVLFWAVSCCRERTIRLLISLFWSRLGVQLTVWVGSLEVERGGTEISIRVLL